MAPIWREYLSNKTRVVVLGAGRVGSAIALDLAGDPSFDVTVADYDITRERIFSAESRVEFLQADLS